MVSLTKVFQLMKNRKEKIAYIRKNYLSRAVTGLEISPNLAPMFSKGDGFDLEYIDALSTEELRQRAQGKGVDISRVPSVDYRHDFSQSIASCVGNKTFDFVASSHVIEHVPDLIGHFQEVKEILNEGGIYVFLAPDKELCFDTQKPDSSLGQLIEAHIEKRRVAPVNAIIDEYYYGVKRGGHGAWSRNESAPTQPKYVNARQLIRDVIVNPNIAKNWHGHIWRFTPQSFQEMYAQLSDLDLVGLRLLDVKPTTHMEFVVALGA
jgi:SAM-dependent methyltransferase